jgi:diguanylate cyclase (GGDEF)-like protein/PAS domain S-box-containing protein
MPSNNGTAMGDAKISLKQTEQVLIQLASIIESSDDAIVGKTLEGIITSWNGGAERMLGYSREEALGQPISFLIPEQYQQEEVILLERIRSGDFVKHYETVRRCKDGKLINVSVSMSPIHDQDGNIVGVSKIARDITERKRAEQGMLDQQARINGLVDAAMDGIVSVDENQNIIIFNHGAEQMFGYRAADIIGQPLDVLVPIRFRGKHRNHVDEFGKTGVTTRTMNQLGEIFGLRSNGDEFPFEATISRVVVAEKGIYTAILRDITLRKQNEEALRLAASVYQASHEGIMVTDDNNLIVDANPAFTKITGYSLEEVRGKNPRIFRSGKHEKSFYQQMWQSVKDNGYWQGEVWDRRKDGELHAKWLSISTIRHNDGSIFRYVGQFSDITEKKLKDDLIWAQANFDTLTNLPNRRLLQDRLKQAFASSARSGREGALLFIDLDNFKTLNDTLGHDIGNLLLQQVARRIESCVQKGDTVARIGGDEFVVILENLSEKDFEAAAQTKVVGEKILASLNQPYQLDTHEYRNSPSIGAALFVDNQKSAEDLFKQADIAMYQSKKAGRNTMRFFNPQMQDTINERAALEGELRKALENRQFNLHYQIQVDSSHRLLGAETLIRWRHPERGLVSPAQFIPLADETGLILPIGQWVLETACAQIKAWQNNPLTRDLVLAVNVSAKQFHQADFVALVQATVQRYAINPKLLKLELTESLLLDNVEDTITTMITLKEIGIRFSLDDFGTGYSSLQYLKRLPLDQIKIDQSFVRDITFDSSDREIVRAIIAIAFSLNLEVIAEGVETKEQRQLLLENGCTLYQGYLFSKPVSIEQFEALLREGF